MKHVAETVRGWRNAESTISYIYAFLFLCCYFIRLPAAYIEVRRLLLESYKLWRHEYAPVALNSRSVLVPLNTMIPQDILSPVAWCKKREDDSNTLSATDSLSPRKAPRRVTRRGKVGVEKCRVRT